MAQQTNLSPRAQEFELFQREASALSRSTLVPEVYRGNVANCMMALNIARRIGADPLMTMQNLDIVHGRPSWRAQFLIGTVNTCGRFSALRYEWFGTRGKDDWGCRAWAIEKETGQKLDGPDISIALAKAEGWTDKKGSKWKTMPQLMLMYRAGAWWTRAYAPELSLGFQTAEETADIIDVTARQVPAADALKRAAAQLGAAKDEPEDAVETVDAETGEITEPADKLSAYLDDMVLEYFEADATNLPLINETVTDGIAGACERGEITDMRADELLAQWTERTKARK